MEEEKFEEVQLQCPDCESKKLQLISLGSSKTEWRFYLLCLSCGSNFYYELAKFNVSLELPKVKTIKSNKKK